MSELNPEKEITPDESLVKYNDKSLARRQDGNYVYDVASNEQQFNAMLKFGESMVKTKFLPSAITTAAQAVAVILTGRELRLAPMQALRSIQIIEGKPCLSAELQLAKFKEAGGHAVWVESTNEKAILELTHPNGDRHIETWTIDDAKKAGLSNKSVWVKYPKAMLRARAISAGIRAVAPDIGMGVYDPEEFGSTSVEIKAEPETKADRVEYDNGNAPEKETTPTIEQEMAFEDHLKALTETKFYNSLKGIRERIDKSYAENGITQAQYDELIRKGKGRASVLEKPKDE